MAPSTYALDYLNNLTQYDSAAPARRPEPIKEREVKPELKVLPSKKTEAFTLTWSGLIGIVLCLALVGALFVGAVFMSAKQSEIKYSINTLTKQNAKLADDIVVMKNKIATANSMETVEAYATVELGMLYPTTTQCIYIENGAVASDDLVSIIREKAYK